MEIETESGTRNRNDLNALKVLSEMIQDRGYVIDIIDTKHEDSLFCIRGHRNNDVILCFLEEDDKLNIQGIKDKISVMNKEGSKKCIIVYRSSVTSSAKKSLETLEYEFELFGIHELQLNITKHRLVPKHSRVTLSEKEELDSKFKGKLPFILHTDAVCRYYGFSKGEYVRITRKNGMIIYRLVK